MLSCLTLKIDRVSYAVLNPFLANIPILYPLKTPENLWFSGVFRRYEMGTLAKNGLIQRRRIILTQSYLQIKRAFVF